MYTFVPWCSVATEPGWLARACGDTLQKRTEKARAKAERLTAKLNAAMDAMERFRKEASAIAAIVGGDAR
jgi:hypothetical protein